MMDNNLPDIEKDFAQWYQEVVYGATLADHSPVRGTMIVRPYGWAIWERMRDQLNARILATGHENAAFPLFIPESFLKKEAEHVEGFAPELAVVTHAGGKELEEPLVVRPTSETIIHYMFAQWIKSWRDLPIKINQWANVVRWELRPRPFIRTTEFFWQEGHTAHETYAQAYEEAHLMLAEYVNFAQDFLAIPVIAGRKTDSERFPGADITLTFEALMQDGKALQMGTSHLISQKFAHAFNMVYQDRDGQQAYPYLTSWGVTTRLVGAVVMVHGDQKGLILPPKVAPIQVVIVPIFKTGFDTQTIINQAREVEGQLLARNIRCKLDDREHKSPGNKFYEWELKGVPIRIEIGPRDVQQQQVTLANRLTHEKQAVGVDRLAECVSQLLETIQKGLFERASVRLKKQWHYGEKLVQFGPTLAEHGELYQTGWCGNTECELQLKNFKAFTRCLIEEQRLSECFNCDLPSKGDVLVAKSY